MDHTKIDKNKLNELGAFEISFEMIELAQENLDNNIFLNAGRGNPNWINTKARLAFNRIVEFGIKESQRTINMADLAGYTKIRGVEDRLNNFLGNNDTDQFIKDALVYCKDKLDLKTDEVIKEFIDGAIGNNYPVPSRALVNTEVILNRYLQETLYNGVDLEKDTLVFPTEGGTAAMVYIFNSLKRNNLIKAGDKIAINTPIFTPYLQIPELAEFDLVEVFVESDEKDNWDISLDELDKLKDPQIKAFFVVNPSNPASKALNQDALQKIKEVVAVNPDLIVLTDDVYGTFVEDFQTVYSVVPENTILVYSYSKLFGATGWRVGLIALHKNNIFDRLISNFDEKTKAELNNRYKIVTNEVDKLSFMERIVADSRSVGLYHTAGLSTPQQIMEALFSLSHLVHEGKDPYFEACDDIVNTRYEDLHEALGIQPDESKENAKYYSIINIYELAAAKYDQEFSDYLVKNFNRLDFLISLAKQNGVVLMDGVGFGTSEGNLRVSQANLPTEYYELIGKQINNLLEEYYDTYKKKHLK